MVKIWALRIVGWYLTIAGPIGGIGLMFQVKGAEVGEYLTIVAVFAVTTWVGWMLVEYARTLYAQRNP